MKRDQEKYRRAVKDVRDYEIYKEVMEATMMRMQQELELYADEASVGGSNGNGSCRMIMMKLYGHDQGNDNYNYVNWYDDDMMAQW